MFRPLLFTSRSQIATAARWKLIPLLLCALSFYCELKYSVFHDNVGLFILFCFFVIFSESVGRKLVAVEQRIDSKNKAVLVTGCDTGFGYSIAARLASSGFEVFAGCLKPSENGGSELSSISNVHCLKMDVSKTEDVEQALKEVTERLGEKELWAVINNAGISKGTEVSLTPIEKIEEVLDVNLLGTIRVTKAAFPLLRKSKGRIVNVASIAGRLKMPGFIPYSVSKQAVIAFSDGLRMEMQKFGVSVISIEPWMYRTRLSDPLAVARDIDKQWLAAKCDLKDAVYTGDYTRELKENTSHLFSKLLNTNVDEVIDDMEDAVTSACAPFFYRPGKWYLNSFLWIMNSLPQPIADFVMCSYVFKNQRADSLNKN